MISREKWSPYRPLLCGRSTRQPASLHRYAYAGHGPTPFVDPNGNRFEDADSNAIEPPEDLKKYGIDIENDDDRGILKSKSLQSVYLDFKIPAEAEKFEALAEKRGWQTINKAWNVH